MNKSSSGRKRLTITLSVIFALAVVMGAGPGVYLVNPDADNPDATFTFLGMPVIYAWVTFWFLVQAIVVLVAYYRLWGSSPTDDSQRTEKAPGTTGVGQTVPDED
jgi:hypothetical protein